jgi:putative hydrolase of the HAD superfamily
MIKAVFFDLHDTLAHYQPPREELHAIACRDVGIEVKPEEILKVLPIADRAWRDESAHFEIGKRSKEDQADVYARYEQKLLRALGAEISRETALRIMGRFQKLGMKFVLFEDTLPTLRKLKGRGLILGLVSNVAEGIDSICRELGLSSILNFVVNSREVGVEKPEPPIFLTALKRAGVKAEEAIYVGDQYDLDVVGARGVGINPILLDRNNSWPWVSDCPKIQSLSQVEQYL